ncbi:MAG: hypothetical protein R6T98_11975 [Desulfatiglandales bacterium]
MRIEQNLSAYGGLPHGYAAEKTSPRAWELKKSPSSLDQEGLCKGFII